MALVLFLDLVTDALSGVTSPNVSSPLAAHHGLVHMVESTFQEQKQNCMKSLEV